MSRIIKKKNNAEENANALSSLLSMRPSEGTLLNDSVNVPSMEERKKQEFLKNETAQEDDQPQLQQPAPPEVPSTNQKKNEVSLKTESQNKIETLPESKSTKKDDEKVERSLPDQNKSKIKSERKQEPKSDSADESKNKKRGRSKVAKATSDKKRYTCHVTKEFHEELNNLLLELAKMINYKMSYSDWMINALRNTKEIPYDEMEKYKEEKIIFAAPDKRFSLYTKQAALENGGYAPKSISFIIDADEFNDALQRAEDNKVVFNQYLVDCMWAQMKYYEKLLEEQK